MSTAEKTNPLADAITQAIEPVRHWYESDEHEPRELPAIIADIVADLQEDRAEILRLGNMSPSSLESKISAAQAFAKRDTERRAGKTAFERAAVLADVIEGLTGELERVREQKRPQITAGVAWLREMAATCKAEAGDRFFADDDEAGEEWRVRGESYAFIADQIERGHSPFTEQAAS